MNDNVITLPNVPTAPKVPAPAELIDWLSFAGDELVKRRDALLEALNTTPDEIEDEPTAQIVIENRKSYTSLIADLKTFHDQQKAPYRQRGETVDAWQRMFRLCVDPVMARVQAAADDYARRKEARIRAERQRLAQEAQERAQEAARAAQEAMRAQEARAAEEALAAAQKAAMEASRAQAQAAAGPADLSRTTGVYGTTASLRTTWTWEIEDESLVPREYLEVSRDKIEFAKKKRDPKTNAPIIQIPGIRWVAKESFR